MSKEKTIEKLITGKASEGKAVNFYCFNKTYGFSLLAYEVGDDGKFILDQNKNRKPLFEENEEGKVKRRKRVQFNFSLIPEDFVKNTNAGKTVEFKCMFSLKGDELYYDDLLAYLNKEASDRGSPIYNQIDYLKASNSEAFKTAEAFAEKEEQYNNKISSLEAEIERLKKGK